MSSDKPWQDMTPDEQANEIHQIKTYALPRASKNSPKR
jgi:hypothetical protein